ncbi:long-chain fatty acid--CoA ligase [Actinocorallia lasiicapitis]
MSFNLATILRESALALPGKAVARFGARTLTYAELERRSARLAAGLLASGLVRGDRVAVQLPNVPEFLVLYFAVVRAGLVLVPVNPMLKDGELAHILDDSLAAKFVTEADLDALALLEGAAEAPIAPTEPHETAVIIYTSGTTGRPKGAELTHFQLHMSCTVAGETFGVRRDDVSLAALPFFHVYGLSGIVNVAIRYGCTLSVVPRFEPVAVLDAMAEHGVSIFAGVPTMFHALLAADAGDRDLSRLRVASSGGAAMPGALLAEFEERFGVLILEGYGLSESGSSGMLNRPGDRRTLSIGKPVWGCDARLVDAAGAVLEPRSGRIGELQLTGHIVMKGYYRNAAATAAALNDGWLSTGDLAYEDTDGFYFIVDRIKDLIIRGGYNVYPREVEEVLYTHPAIAEAAVFGRPDERLGEEVVAAVTVRPGAELDPAEVVAFCRDRLAAYKYPREVRVLDRLPRNGTGKILKRELR